MQNILKNPSVEEKILNRLEKLSGKVDTVQLMYYNPKSKDKSHSEPPLPFDPRLIDGQKFMKKLDGESERYHRLFLYYLDNRSFDLAVQFSAGLGKRLNKRQIFNVARKFKWKERVAKYDSEMNCEIMENLHCEYIIEKRKKLQSLTSIFNQSHTIMSTMENNILVDFDALSKNREMSDIDRLKQVKMVMSIYKDYIFVIEHIEKIFAEYGIQSYDPFAAFEQFESEFGEEEEFEDYFAEAEKKDRERDLAIAEVENEKLEREQAIAEEKERKKQEFEQMDESEKAELIRKKIELYQKFQEKLAEYDPKNIIYNGFSQVKKIENGVKTEEIIEGIEESEEIKKENENECENEENDVDEQEIEDKTEEDYEGPTYMDFINGEEEKSDPF